MGARRGGAIPSSAAQKARKAFTALFAPGDSWFEADNVSGSDWVDYNDPTHKLVLTAGSLAAPAADALFAGSKSFIYTGSQRSVSNRPPSAWKSDSDGTGSTRILILCPTIVSITQIFSTTAGAVQGASAYASGTNAGTSELAAGVAILNIGSAVLLAGTPAAMTVRYSSSAADLRYNGSVIATAGATSPNASNPEFPLTIGWDPQGTYPAVQARYEGIFQFRRVLTTAELSVAAAYVLLKTGRVL